ncbi:hypothetical protein V3F56_00555 [Moorellaceae bacterium AZ2]
MAEKEKGKEKRALSPSVGPGVGAGDFELGPEVAPGTVFPGKVARDRKEKERNR